MAASSPNCFPACCLRGECGLASASHHLPIFGPLTICVKRGGHFLAASTIAGESGSTKDGHGRSRSLYGRAPAAAGRTFRRRSCSFRPRHAGYCSSKGRLLDVVLLQKVAELPEAEAEELGG